MPNYQFTIDNLAADGSFSVLRYNAEDTAALPERRSFCPGDFAGLAEFAPGLEQRAAQHWTPEVVAAFAGSQPQGIVTETDLEGLRQSCIEQSKLALADYLRANPLESAAHGGQPAFYTATAEKQALLAAAVTVAGLAGEGESRPVLWNAAGMPREEWSYAELCRLALEMDAYVAPLVAHQQALELQMKRCATEQELLAIAVDYSATAGTGNREGEGQ